MLIPLRKGKVAGPGQIAATFLEAHDTCGIEKTDDSGNTPEATGQAAALRHLRARLDQLSLPHSGQEDESIFIAGQAYDLRSATAMVRQLGRATA